jgi:mono/diheme cytochrome c family protein
MTPAYLGLDAMRTLSTLPALFLAGSIAGSALLAAYNDSDSGQARDSAEKPAEPIVTPVAGPSWLNHLNLTYRDSSLGRGPGRYGRAPGEPAPIEGRPAARDSTSAYVAGQSAVLTGVDLYRLNCQACHRAEGTGSPPEIKSVMDLVQGSSFEFVRRQLQHDNIAASAATIRAQVNAARTELYRRIREGGQRMPSLAHLQEADIDLLYAYLSELARTPDSKGHSPRTVSWARLGEHVIKGTCHICHDATGPRPTPDAMLVKGVIPPLTVLIADNPQVDFIRKARSGAPVFEGRPLFHYRGRMPVFYYLRDEELAAAYDYLVAYPPQAAPAKQH